MKKYLIILGSILIGVGISVPISYYALEQEAKRMYLEQLHHHKECTARGYTHCPKKPDYKAYGFASEPKE